MSCNEVQSSNVDTDFNAKRINDMFAYWISKPNIKNRYTRPDGTFMQQIAENGLKSWARDILEYPFVKEQNFTDKQLSRLKVSIDAHNKDLLGKFSNIAGIFAVPRGLARLDPTSSKFLSKLEDAKNYERNKMSYVEDGIQKVKDLILFAHVSKGKGGKLFGNKSYKEFRNIRDSIIKAKDMKAEITAHNEVKAFYLRDEGRLLGEYSALVKLGSKTVKDKSVELSELDQALKDGYVFGNKMVKYNPQIIEAVKKTHEMLDEVGKINIAALEHMQRVIDFKFTRFAPQRKQLVAKLDSAKDRIQDGIDRGDYFPKVLLETMYEMKTKLEDILPEHNMTLASDRLNELNGITDGILKQLDKPPKNTEARSHNLNLLWEQDPYVVLEKYSRDAIGFNKNIHIQSAYLGALKDMPRMDTAFLKGMKSFLMEEYLVANSEGRSRPAWVNDMVRTVNSFQTARTMGLNLTGGIKNAASVLHYTSKVGLKSIRDARRSYQDLEIKKIVDKVEREEGFLFAPANSEILMEGLVGRDKYNRDELIFDESKGEYYYKDTKVRDLIDKVGDKSLGFLLTFHRWTENAQRKFMFRTSFITKFNELTNTSSLKEKDKVIFAKNYALKSVNGWAYEYAPFAKNKWVRGSQNIEIVDEIGDSYIVRKGPKAVGAGVSEIAFHLMHYPMSLLETHISHLKGAGQAFKAGNWDSPEMKYLMRYAGVFGLIQLGSIIFNANLNNILENETINRLGRIERDLLEYDDKDRATFGLLSEFSGPTIGHLKYFSIVGGLIKLDSPLKKIMLGNVDYTEDTEESRRYTDYQYSTEYGRFKHKIWPALRDGRSSDLFRHYLAFYPAPWIKEARKTIGLGKKSKKSKYTMAEQLYSLRLLD